MSRAFCKDYGTIEPVEKIFGTERREKKMLLLGQSTEKVCQWMDSRWFAGRNVVGGWSRYWGEVVEGKVSDHNKIWAGNRG